MLFKKKIIKVAWLESKTLIRGQYVHSNDGPEIGLKIIGVLLVMEKHIKEQFFFIRSYF